MVGFVDNDHVCSYTIMNPPGGFTLNGIIFLQILEVQEGVTIYLTWDDKTEFKVTLDSKSSDKIIYQV